MIRIRSTPNCVNTPRVLIALEEAGVAYETAPVEPGYFRATYGVVGPSFEDGDLEIVEPGAVLRHVGRAYGLMPRDLRGQAEADRWIDFYRRLGDTMYPDPKREALIDQLRHVERRLADGPFLLGSFSIVDCGYASLNLPDARRRLPLDALPGLTAWLDRIAARPSWARATARVP